MKVKTLHNLLKIASKISNQSSLTNLYRSFELRQDAFRCCSEFGNLEIWIDKNELTEPVLLDTVAVMAVTSSLASEAELTLEKTDSQVKWKSGSAKGHWNLVQCDHEIPYIQHTNFPWQPPKEFSEALRLAASACQAAAVSVGLYGISIKPEGDKLKMMSSNTISLAVSSVALDNGAPTTPFTVRPPVPAVLGGLLDICPNCKLDITDNGIFVLGDWLAAHLPVSIPLEHDLTTYADKYKEQKQAAKINASALKKFINRAKVLSEKNPQFSIKLCVEQGKLLLEHEGTSSKTEEYFLAEGLDPAISFASVALPADMLLIPLEHVQFAVFDYMADQTLVLKGEQPDFVYAVGGGE